MEVGRDFLDDRTTKSGEAKSRAAALTQVVLLVDQATCEVQGLTWLVQAGSASSRIRYRCPAGEKLVTLRDAADYITSLPKKESDLPEWQTAIEVLMLVSRSGPTMLARIGVMKALNRHVERVFNRERKDIHWGNGS